MKHELLRWLERPEAAWAILGASLFFTWVAWTISDRSVIRRAQDRFIFQTEEVRAAIQDRMLDYEQVLRGAVGLFAASDRVTRDDWHAYVSILEVGRHYPGLDGIGFTLLVRPDERLAHVREVREEGYPDYAIRPDARRDEYHPTIYLEPFEGRNIRAFGFDMYSDPVRRGAMQRARDRGLPAASGVVAPAQASESEGQLGFVMFVPVYRHGMPQTTVGERRHALLGFVYSPFRARDLMAGILGSWVPDVDLEVYDSGDLSAEGLLFNTDSRLDALDEGGPTSFRRMVSLIVGARPWTLCFTARPAYASAIDRSQPLAVAAIGLLVDLLLFALIAGISLARKRAVTLADRMTAELQHTNADLRCQILERRSAEEALRASQEELSRRAGELSGANADLARANGELQHFAYVASHDLQEPLRVVASYLQLLQRRYGGQLDREADVFIGHAVDAATRMRTLIDDLLAYSRLTSAGPPPAPTSLDDALDRALRNLQLTIDETEARVTRDPLPVVLADGTQMTQLFQNLVGNALKFRGQTPPRVRVESIARPDAWVLAVRDNGIGLDTRYADRIFHIFQRLHTRHEYPGTGVGLAICKKIIERHGGRLWVESEPGKGAAFFFTLPAKGAHTAWSSDQARDRSTFSSSRIAPAMPC